MAEPTPRHVSPLTGAYNFRDLGGLPAGPDHRVRAGVLFRSDTLQALTDADVMRLVARIGVELLVDLRLGPETVSEDYGGAEGWAATRGLPASAPIRLRAGLLEPAGG